MPAREGFRSQGTCTQGEQPHETCSQDVNPDGWFGLHIRGGCRPGASRSGRWTDPRVYPLQIEPQTLRSSFVIQAA